MDPQQLEALCQDFYGPGPPERRSAAEQSLYSFLQNCPIPHLLSTITYSSMPQLVFLALSTLSKRLTQQWNDLPLEDKLFTEQTLVAALFESQAGRLQPYAVGVTAQALSRVTRLGWLEHEQYRATVTKALEAGKQSHYHCALALKYFEELISDVTEPIKCRPVTMHRKIALNFRDEALFSIVSFTHMLILQAAGLPRDLLDQTLSVFYKCFSFDFLGIIPEEISEDPVCIQIPITWAPLIEDSHLLESLEALCLSTTDETQHNVLRCINQMGAARKSVFSSVDQRREYSGRFLTTLSHICDQVNLTGDALYEYVQLTKRFFMNFQVRELVELAAFQYWLQAFYNCSIRLFNNETALVNPFASGLGLWSYLATEAHHHLQQSQTSLAVVVPNLFLNYLQNTLKFATQDFLVESYPDMKDNLDCAGLLNAYYYSQAMRELQNMIEKLQPQFPSKQASGQIAWVVYLCGALIGLSEKSLKEREEQIDSKTIAMVFEVSRACDQIPEYHPALEMALIYFMNSVRKAYINTPHDTLVLFYEERIDDELNRNSLNETKVLEVVDRMVQKILSNLSRFQGVQQLVSASLELLDEMLRGYYSNKLVVQLPIAQQIMTQYRMLDLFKSQPKNRQRLYSSLAQLWVGETAATSLDEYLEPMRREIIAQLNEGSLPQDWVLLVLSELRGVCAAIANQKNYLLFYDWLYPAVFPLIPKVVEQHMYSDEVMTSVYRFLNELVTSRNSRIRFDIATANGIILFKEVTQVLLGFGKAVLDRSVTASVYKQKYRYVLLTLEIMTKLMAGGYVVFGVFQSFPKIYEIAIDFLELITKSHLPLVLTAFSSETFDLILALLSQGFKTDSIKICMEVSNSVNYLCEYLFKAIQRDDKPGYQQAVSSRMSELLQLILEIVLTEDNNFMWTLSKPLLGLIIICEMQFEQVRNFVVQKVLSDVGKQEKIMQAFVGLMNGVSRSLDVKNRDKFSRNFSELRQIVISLGIHPLQGMEVMEEVSLSAELRENASVLASQLLDSQALLQTLAAKSSLISQLQFERDQFLTQQQRLQAAAQLIPTQLSRISGELQTAKTQLETETLLNQKLQVTASAHTPSPAAGQKELKRLRKLRAAKETAIVRLKEEIHSCRNDTGVRLIIEPPSHSQDSLDTELHSVREGNRALRQQIARLERKMVSIGAKIDRLRRLQSVHKQVKPLETPMTPLSQRDTAAPSSPLLDRKVVVEPNSVPSDVLALFRMPQSRKPTRLGKYSASQDMKDAYYLPIPLEFPSSPQFLAFKSELHLMLSLYQSDAECPKEHVDIVATSFEKVQEKEAAVDFLVTALSGVCKAMSAPDARFFLVSVLKMTQSKEVLWSIAKYAVSDFYRNRKWEGGKHQWCSESNGVSTLQEMWVEVTVTSLTRCNEVVLLRKLVKLLCVHHNTPLLHYLHSTHQSLPGLTCLPLLTTLDSHTDEALSGVLITSPWSLEDRIWTLKCVTALRGTAFINFFLTHHMAPIFTSTLPGTEARLFYFHCISLALKSMKGESSWSSTRAHLIQVLQVISPSLHYQGQSVFTAAETATAAAILAKI